MTNDKIGAIIVLYNPNLDLLKKSISVLRNQINHICIVDNTPCCSIDGNFFEDVDNNIKYVPLGKNLGIAEAQNIGIKWIKDIPNIEYVFFLDQDSIIEFNTIQILSDKYDYLVEKGYNVGGVGPRPFNREQRKEYSGSVKKGKRIDDNITEVTELISSASLIPVKFFEIVGDMDSSLFIDGVDHEWCWRCTKTTGARFFICENTLLSHKLGEGDHNFFLRKVSISTPFRTYFQFRNYFILLKRNYVPLYWKLSNGFKYCIKFLYYPLFITPRKEYLKNMWRGLRDGIKMMFDTK